MDEKQIRKDRLRYTKNTLSSGLSYLAILLNVFYFVSIYKSDVGNYYYTWLTGLSIVFNLIFMLTVFLSSEGVKNYSKSYSVILIVVGLIQIVRTQIIPKKAFAAVVTLAGEEIKVMGNAQYTRVLIYLLGSACLLIIAGVAGIIKSRTLEAYTKELESRNK